MRKRNVDVSTDKCKNDRKKNKNLCDEKGFSVKEVQNYLGLSCIQTVYSWYSGKTLPSTDNLIVLSRLFDTNLESIICVDFVNN